ncbi:MAG: helix-turn-helix transcriptional regulator [Rhodobiaceae bacterium]|nr:helix-turn-helix transcriptional regulator [Rhodobiaceae bacterium]
MLTHRAIWEAIDALAERHHLSASGLARKAGLDPTAFNKSKRRSRDGRERWPSTESLAKVLEATGESIDRFMDLADRMAEHQPPAIPLIGLEEASQTGYFDDTGCPSGPDWEAIPFPDIGGGNVYAMEVTGDSLLPLYRDGDIVIVAPGDPVRRGDRVVVRTGDGAIMARILKRKTRDTVELAAFNAATPDLNLPANAVTWMARIIWASQ